MNDADVAMLVRTNQQLSNDLAERTRQRNEIGQAAHDYLGMEHQRQRSISMFGEPPPAALVTDLTNAEEKLRSAVKDNYEDQPEIGATDARLADRE
jgi:hypothetical protein